MAIDFPSSPTNGQTFTSGSVTYTWDGTKWTAVASGGGGSGDIITEGNTSAEVIDTGSDGRFVVTTEGVEALRVDSSGGVGVGASPTFDSGNGVHIHNSTESSIHLTNTSSGTASTDGAYIGYNSNALLLRNTELGATIRFQTYDSERVRIDGSGRLLVGTSSAPSSSGTGSGFVPEGDGRAVLYMRTNTTGGRVLCNFGNSNGEVGSIQVSGTSTSYVTSSDYRLKENVTPVADGITRLQQLKPSRFNFIADPSTIVDGFIAHEVQTVVPEAITGEKDEVDDDGNPIYQGIDQSKLVPLLTAALQEAIGEIESLKARVAALESA